jgi:hypothetical protein
MTMKLEIHWEIPVAANPGSSYSDASAEGSCYPGFQKML